MEGNHVTFAILPTMGRSFRSENRVKIVTTILSLLIATGALLSQFRFVGSGFFWWSRLPNLVADYQAGSFSIGSYSTFPLAPSLILSLSQLTGLQPTAVIYVPFLLLLAFTAYFLLGREVLDNDVYVFASALSLTVYHYGRLNHFLEYPTGNIAFVFFLWAVICYRSDRKRMLAVLLPFYLIVKGFSPHAEVWVLSLLAIIVISIPIFEQIESLDFRARWSGGVSILFTVIFFTYHPKIYRQGLPAIFVSEKRDATVLGTVVSLGTSVFESGATATGEYVTAALTPPITRYTNVLYIAVLFVGLVFATVALAGSVYRDRSLAAVGSAEIFITLACLSMVPDFLVLAGQGLLNISKLVILVPIALFRYVEISNPIHTDLVRYAAYAFAIVIVILPVVYAGGTFALDTHYPLGSVDSAETTSEWVVEYEADQYDRINLLTDLNSAGILKVKAVQATQTNPYALTTFSNERYAYLTGQNRSHRRSFDIFVFNERTAQLPVQRGYPTWQYYDPLSEHRTAIVGNPDLHNTYDSGQYVIYE
jgi:hypothetical protein